MKQYVKTFESFYNDYRNYDKLHESINIPKNEKYPDDAKSGDKFSVMYPFYLSAIDPKKFDLNAWLNISSDQFYKIFNPENSPEGLTPLRFILWMMTVASGKGDAKLEKYADTTLAKIGTNGTYIGTYNGNESFGSMSFYLTDDVENKHKFDKLLNYKIHVSGTAKGMPMWDPITLDELIKGNFKNTKIYKNGLKRKYPTTLHEGTVSEVEKHLSEYIVGNFQKNFEINFFGKFSEYASKIAFAPAFAFAANNKTNKWASQLSEDEKKKYFESIERSINYELSNDAISFLKSKNIVIDSENNQYALSIKYDTMPEDVKENLYG